MNRWRGGWQATCGSLPSSPQTAAAKIDKAIEENNLSHRVNAVIEDRQIILGQI
ncbi:MAG: hypothetical protein P8J37_21900 [Fuerstiella sp.]|nr:hypothetical protein [Fuerstiella sp.]